MREPRDAYITIRGDEYKIRWQVLEYDRGTNAFELDWWFGDEALGPLRERSELTEQEDAAVTAKLWRIYEQD